MSDIIHLTLDEDLRHLSAMLRAMEYTLGDDYWKDDQDGHARYDTLMSLIEYAQGLQQELQETATKLSCTQPAPCQAEAITMKGNVT